jgi:tetratricopeptide (TPR) repeat protein
MKAKIDWYKEVLELEPGSKVFFPLARLLAENGQWQDALSTLRLGLERHPEFIEARLYLIELLYKNEQIVQCEPQIGHITRLFSKYPGFWEAWSAVAAGTEKKRDLSLTLRFLAVLFQHPDVDLGAVLEKGLHSLTGAPEKIPAASQPAMETSKKILPAADAVAPPSSAMPADAQMPAVAVDAAVHGPSPAAKRAEDMDETEEPFTLRTKSMADVLAGQSDIDGALEIYHELALRAESPAERQEIHARILQLSSLPEQADDAPSAPPPAVAPPPGKQRMQHLLESLAERLEARALG